MSYKERILITGGTGFLGSYIARKMVKGGFDVCVLARPDSDRSLLESIVDQIHFIEGDLLDVPSLEDAIEDIDRVVHAAALVGFDPARRDEMYEVNVTGTGNLVNVALGSKIRQFIHISSTAALGRKKRRDSLTEDSIWHPSKYNSKYAISKRKAELEAWRGFAEGLPVVVLNPAVILGAGFWKRPPVDLITRIYQGLLFYPTGSNGFVDVRDVADFVKIVIDMEKTGERFILSSGNYEWKTIFDRIAASLNVVGPRFPATKIITALALPFIYIKGRLQGSPPVLTRESARISRGQFDYNNSRSVENHKFSYRPIEETIEQTCDLFLKSWPKSQKHAFFRSF